MKEIKHSWHFNQLPKEVWEYLTKPELMEQWLMKTDFKPVVGHQFYFIGECNDDGKVAAQCKVLEVKPFTKLSYSWQANSIKNNQPFDSTVTWTIVPEQNGTELQLLHNGFTMPEDVLAHNDGWTRTGNKITEYLNAVEI
jgi:uncharacterized protein YndB with AHSA1/START domain